MVSKWVTTYPIYNQAISYNPFTNFLGHPSSYRSCYHRFMLPRPFRTRSQSSPDKHSMEEPQGKSQVQFSWQLLGKTLLKVKLLAGYMQNL